MLYCGIDCGFTGYICFIDKNINDIILYKMPVVKDINDKNTYDIDKLIDIFMEHRYSRVFIERQWARPRQCVSSGSKIVYGYGLLMGICSAINKNVITESPSYWQNFIKEKYLTETEIKCFRRYSLDYSTLLSNINNSQIKKRFNQLINMKSIKPSKIESLYLFYKIFCNYNNILESINIRNHNIIDAFLMSYVCSKAI